MLLYAAYIVRGCYLGKSAQSCGRYFMTHVEVLLYPSPFQQHPQVLPAPGAMPPGCPRPQAVTEPTAWHRGMHCCSGPRCPQRLPWRWAELQYRLALGLWLSGLKAQVCLSSLAHGAVVAAAWCMGAAPVDLGTLVAKPWQAPLACSPACLSVPMLWLHQALNHTASLSSTPH